MKLAFGYCKGGVHTRKIKCVASLGRPRPRADCPAPRQLLLSKTAAAARALPPPPLSPPPPVSPPAPHRAAGSAGREDHCVICLVQLQRQSSPSAGAGAAVSRLSQLAETSLQRGRRAAAAAARRRRRRKTPPAAGWRGQQHTRSRLRSRAGWRPKRRHAHGRAPDENIIII